MGVKWLFFCVLYQAIITTSSGIVKLPFTDIEAQPLPKTSSSLPTENGLSQLSSPINPKLRKALLEYFKLKYLGTNQQSSNMDECESPVVISSSSRVLPLPKIETQTVDDLMNIIEQNSIMLPISPYTSDVLVKPNTYSETSIPLNNKVKLTSVPTVQSIYERVIPNGISLPSITSLPIISLESLKRNGETLAEAAYPPNVNSPCDNKIYFDGYPTKYPLYNVPYPLRYNRLSLPDVITPSNLILSNLNPINNVENLRSISSNTLKIINSYPNAYSPTSSKGLYALDLAPQISALNNENPHSFITQRLPKVPLSLSTSPNSYSERQQYNYLNHQKHGRKIDPLSEQALLNTLVPLPYLRNCDISYLSGLNLGNSYYPTSYEILRTLPEPIIPEANQYGLKMSNFEYETLPLSVNELNADINNINNIFTDNTQPTIDIIIDTTIHCNIPENIEDYITGTISDLDLSEIPKEIPSSITIQVTPHENNVDSSSLVLPIDLSFLNNNEKIEPSVLYENSISDVSSLTTINYPPKLPQTAFAATYINVSPTYSLSQISANAVSSLNDVVSSLTRTILNSFISCLTSAQSKVTTTVSPIPYTTSSLGFHNTNLLKPSVPQYRYTSTFPPLNTYSTTTFLPLEPPFYDEIPLTSTTTTNTYSNDVTATTSVTSSPPLKVTLLPPTSFLDYLPSQPCPSSLPLPTLPSYFDVSSPFTPKPQVFNVKPLDRRSKTVERLLDMVLLAELMHGEGYIDWDALDTVLALLYAT